MPSDAAPAAENPHSETWFPEILARYDEVHSWITEAGCTPVGPPRDSRPRRATAGHERPGRSGQQRLEADRQPSSSGTLPHSPPAGTGGEHRRGRRRRGQRHAGQRATRDGHGPRRPRSPAHAAAFDTVRLPGVVRRRNGSAGRRRAGGRWERRRRGPTGAPAGPAHRRRCWPGAA
jgi:hypothetical protein